MRIYVLSFATVFSESPDPPRERNVTTRRTNPRSCEHILILRHRHVRHLPGLVRMPASLSSSSVARSWPGGSSCYRQRALGSGQWACSLGSSTQSSSVRLFRPASCGGNMTSDSGAGSRADSSDSHTLGPSSSSCSLLDFDDSTRCARHRLHKPTCPDGLRRPLAGWFYRPPSCPTVAPSLVRRRWPLWAPPPSSAATWCRPALMP